MNTRRLALVLLYVLLAAGALVMWLRSRDAGTVPIAGVGDALPRADPQGEFILPEALEAARVQGEQHGLRALLVHRRGHRVFEYWKSEADAHERVEGGELAAAVLALTLLEPGEAGSSDAQQVAALVHERLWLPLRAGEAGLRLRTDSVPRRCCIEATTDDWMRVGDLLLAQGAWLGERFVSTDAVRQWLASRQPAPAQGDEPLVARDGLWFDLHGQARLWLAPRRNLAVLVWGSGGIARDTLIPNIILRGLGDQAPAISGEIGDIVPGH